MITDLNNGRDKKMEKATVLLTLAAEKEKVHGPCLSDEEMAGLVDGQCRGAELAEFWVHLSSCNRCYDQWLFLKKSMRQEVPQGRMYQLRRLKKIRYIGTALAAAASIAVYLNVVKMEDATVEQVVAPQIMLIQEKNTANQPPKPSAAKEEKNVPARMIEQVPAALPAAPTTAPMAVGSGAAKGQLEMWQVPQRSVEKRKEMRPKSAAVVSRQAESKVAKDAERDMTRPLAENESAPVAASPMEDAGDWLEQLRTACLSGQVEASFWADLSARGLRLQALKASLPAVEADDKIVRTLALLQGINGPDTVPQQCRLILAELAKEAGNR
ncbi:MAG: hypothetical protein KJ630_19645 [Proteobacteria bacterium]|nr:hypothetical protein [Pseudomonadota bacterium]